MSKNPEFASPEYPEGGDCAQHSAVVADSPETCRVIRLPSGRNIRCVTPYSLEIIGGKPTDQVTAYLAGLNGT